MGGGRLIYEVVRRKIRDEVKEIERIDRGMEELSSKIEELAVSKRAMIERIRDKLTFRCKYTCGMEEFTYEFSIYEDNVTEPESISVSLISNGDVVDSYDIPVEVMEKFLRWLNEV